MAATAISSASARSARASQVVSESRAILRPAATRGVLHRAQGAREVCLQASQFRRGWCRRGRPEPFALQRRESHGGGIEQRPDAR